MHHRICPVPPMHVAFLGMMMRRAHGLSRGRRRRFPGTERSLRCFCPNDRSCKNGKKSKQCCSATYMFRADSSDMMPRRRGRTEGEKAGSLFFRFDWGGRGHRQSQAQRPGPLTILLHVNRSASSMKWSIVFFALWSITLILSDSVLLARCILESSLAPSAVDACALRFCGRLE